MTHDMFILRTTNVFDICAQCAIWIMLPHYVQAWNCLFCWRLSSNILLHLASTWDLINDKMCNTFCNWAIEPRSMCFKSTQHSCGSLSNARPEKKLIGTLQAWVLLAVWPYNIKIFVTHLAVSECCCGIFMQLYIQNGLPFEGIWEVTFWIVFGDLDI